MNTEKEKMLSGELFYPLGEELTNDRNKVKRLLDVYNRSSIDEGELRIKILKEVLGSTGEEIFIEQILE